jgi:hypothetical protein
MYIAFAVAWSARPSPATRIGQFALVAGLLLCLFWNPPYPYPYENNLAMVDFVRLHQQAADFVERSYPGQKITTAWPLSIELRRPANGYVKRRMAVQEVAGFHTGDLQALDRASVGPFVLFSREWDAGWDLRRAPLVAPLMRKFYGYQQQIAPSDLERLLGLRLVVRWSERGQWIAVYERALPAGSSGTVQHFPNLRQQSFGRERLAQEGGAAVECAVFKDGVFRVAGHVEDLEAGTQARSQFGQVLPAHAGHDDVGQEKMDGAGVALAPRQSLAGVGGQ